MFVAQGKDIQTNYKTIFQYTPFDAEESAELFRCRDFARAVGDSNLEQRILESIVLHNMKLVYSVVMKKLKTSDFYTERQFDDAMQEGAIGLLQAAQQYTADRGTTFSTFAWVVVARYLSNNLMTISPIDIPKRKRMELAAFKSAVATSSPTDDVVAKLNWNPAKIKRIRNIQNLMYMHHLEQPCTYSDAFGKTRAVSSGPEKHTLTDIVAGKEDVEASVETNILMGRLYDAIYGILSEKEIDIISRKFSIGEHAGHPQSIAEIADIYGVSRQLMNRIVNNIQNKLRNHIQNKIG